MIEEREVEAEVPQATSDDREARLAAVEEVLDRVDPLGTAYGARGEYRHEARTIVSEFDTARSVQELELVVRTAFQDVSDHVADERHYGVVAQRLWSLK